MSATKVARGEPKNRLPAKNNQNIFKRFWKTRFLFILFLPALVYFIMFKYVPMWGVSIAFYRYSIFKGISGSKFIGLYHFKTFFQSPEWWQYTKNTFALGAMGVFITFPLTIIFALLLNEVRGARFKKVTQTVSYLPHFLSTVVVVGIFQSLCDPTTGAINTIIKFFGGQPIYFFTETKWFRPLYEIEALWKGLGWGTIVYLAAISSVDPGLYEAARLDGAGRFRQMMNITIPSIMPTVSTMFIMKIGHILGDSLEKVLLMQTAVTYEVSQTISTYSYYVGMSKGNYDYGTAISLYCNIVNLVFLFGSNYISKKLTENSIF